MLRNWYLSKVWHFLGFWFRRKSQIGWDHLLTFFLRLPHGFLHNDLVHRAMEVKFDFKEDVSGFNVLFLLQFSRCSRHFHDSSFLLSIKVCKFLNRHEVNEKVVSNLRISVNSLAMSLSNSLSKNSWVFRIVQKIDPAQFDIFSLFDCLRIPVSGIFLSFFIVVVDQDRAP